MRPRDLKTKVIVYLLKNNRNYRQFFNVTVKGFLRIIHN